MSKAQGIAQSANQGQFKNRIINGAMMIDQRNAGASVTANDGIYTLDRWYYNAWQNGKGTIQRSTTAPTGFINSLLFTSSSAYSVGAGETFDFQQRIADNSTIPFDPANTDYQAYLAWVAEGNLPLPADEQGEK